MRKPQPSRTSDRTTQSHRGPQIAWTHAIILIDDRPLRSKAFKEFKRLHKSFLTLSAQIENHERVVRPAFHRWYAKKFGELVARIEKLGTQVQEKSLLLDRMQALWFFAGLSRRKAFQQATEEFDSLRNRHGDHSDENDEETYEGSSYGGRSDRSHEYWHFSPEMDESKPRVEHPTEKNLKYYYRKLAQFLHPDLGGAQNDFARELWHETQQAFKDHDIEQLKLLWTFCLLQAEAQSHEIGLTDIKNALTYLRDKVREVKKTQRRLATKDPAWGFTTKDQDTLAEDILSELQESEMNLLDELQDVEREIARFARQSRSRQSADSSQSEFELF